MAAVVMVGFRPLAGTREFDFKDPKGVSGLTIRIDSPLEPVSGHANGITGNISFDPEKPEAAKGKVAVQLKTLTLGNSGMTDAMHGEWALDVAKYPTAEFEITKVSQVKPNGKDAWTAKVDGKFTLHGVTKPLSVTASASHVPGGLKQRGGVEGKDGDLLIVRSSFTIQRKDYGVAPDLSRQIIGENVQIDLAFVGVAIQ